jgi:hypothetical protein
MGVVQTGTTDAQTNFGNYAPIIPEIFAAVKGIFVSNPMEVYTKFTGGREENFAGLSGLEEAVTRIGREIHSQYILTFRPSNTDGGYHPITVRVLTRPDLDVKARAGYWIAPRQN